MANTDNSSVIPTTQINGGEDWSQFEATQNVDFANNSIIRILGIDFDGAAAHIQGLVALNFFDEGSRIYSLENGIHQTVASGDAHYFEVDSVLAMRIYSDRIDCANHELINVKEVRFQDVGPTTRASNQKEIGYSSLGMFFNLNGDDDHYRFYNQTTLGFEIDFTTLGGRVTVHTTQSKIFTVQGSDISGNANGVITRNAAGDVLIGSGGNVINLSNITPTIPNWSTVVANSTIDAGNQLIQKVLGIDLDGTTATIQGIVNLNFFDAGSTIVSMENGLHYGVASGDAHYMEVNGSLAFRFYSDRLDFAQHDALNLKTIRFGNPVTSRATNQNNIGYSTVGMYFNLNNDSLDYDWFNQDQLLMELETTNAGGRLTTYIVQTQLLTLQSSSHSSLANGIMARTADGDVLIGSGGSTINLTTLAANMGTDNVNVNRYLYNVRNYGTVGAENASTNLQIDLGNATTSHIHTFTARGDIGLSFINKPANDKALFFVLQISQDATGNHSVTTSESLTGFDISGDGGSTTVLTGMILAGNIFLTNYGSRITNVIGTPTNAARLWSEHVATQDVNLDDNDLTRVANIDLDGVGATIQGLYNLQFFHTTRSINSVGDGLSYQAGAGEHHQFIAGGTTIARFIESVSGIYILDMQDHAVRNAKEVRFDSNATYNVPSNSIAIGYDNGNNRLRVNVPLGNTILFASNGATSGISLNPSGTISATIANLRTLQLTVSNTPQTAVGGFRQNGTNVYIYSGGEERNISLVGTNTGGIQWNTPVNASLVPDTDLGTRNLGSNSNYFGTLYTLHVIAQDTIHIAANSARPVAATQGSMWREGNDIMAWTSSGIKNLDNIGTSMGGGDSNINLLSVPNAILPSQGNSFDLGSELNGWRVVHVREIEFVTVTSAPTDISDTQITKNQSGTMAFNVDTAGAGFTFYYQGNSVHTMTETTITTLNMSIQESITLNPTNITYPLSNGLIHRFGDTVRIHANDRIVDIGNVLSVVPDGWGIVGPIPLSGLKQNPSSSLTFNQAGWDFLLRIITSMIDELNRARIINWAGYDD